MLLRCYRFRRLVLAIALVQVGSSLGAHASGPPLPGHPHFAIHHFGERFGLSAATVISLAQDTRGFLWIGTQSGLFRYDGTNVQRFGLDEGLPSEFVGLIVIAPDGAVWVGTRKGIARLDGARFTAVSLPAKAGEPGEVAQSFALDGQGTLYVSTQGGLLVLANGKASSNKMFTADDGLQSNQIDAIIRDQHDAIWFAAGQKIYRLTRAAQKLESFSSLQAPSQRVRALLMDSQGQLWIRTTAGVATLDTRSAGTRPLWLEGNIPQANIFGTPGLDAHGSLMLPTSQGLFRYKNRKWQIIDHSNGLTSSAVFSALEDREGDIWVGLAGAGLDHWPNSEQWSGWTDAEGLPDALVLGIARDSKSRIWAGTNTSLAMWDPRTDRWQTWKSHGLDRAGIRQLLMTPDGALWALAPGKGLFRIDATRNLPSTAQVPIPPDWQPRYLTASSDGSVFADGDGVLHVIRFQKGTFVVEERSVPSEVFKTTSAPSMSSSGVLWSGGSGGLSRFAKGKWQHFAKQDGLIADSVQSVRAVGENDAWVGYAAEGSVTRVQLGAQGQIKATHYRSGTCSFGKDREGNVWLEMQQALGVVSSDGKLRRITQADGLLWDDVNCGAFWEESDGTILIGTSRGLARFDPRQHRGLPLPPTVVLTSAQLGGKERLAQYRPQVEYRDRTFVLRFAALALRNPHAIACRYRLQGLESDITSSDLREVRYSALDPGAYKFVLSCGSDEVGWSEPVSYSFEIRTPWWSRWWAITSFVLSLTGMLYALARYRSRLHRKEREALETAVTERSAELAKANRELQEASLRDPLTGVRNRRFFHATIPADASQAIRAYRSEQAAYSTDHRDLIFFFIDIDYFKEVNDQYGHDAGDQVLVELARRLDRITRTSDFLIRWGGEEFLLVCRSANRDEAYILAGRVLAAVANQPFDTGTGYSIQLTCSLGWAPFPWSLGSVLAVSMDHVLRLADRGLYMAKRRGRNQGVGLLPPDRTPAEASEQKLNIDDERMVFKEICTAGPKVEVSEPGPVST